MLGIAAQLTERLMYKGSCLCGAIAYEISGELGPIICCHCVRCRKANGSAFASVSPVPSVNFHWLKGEDLLHSFSVEGVHRFFCRQCASPLMSRRDAFPGVVRVRIGSLDTPIAGPVAAHIFTDFKAEWYEILDGQPQYKERMPS